MASTNKTTNYGLNQWIGSDIPKRADFNSDNSIIDSTLGTHILNKDIHITAAERTLWNTQCVVGFYLGTGSATREINVGYQPKVVIVYAVDKPIGSNTTNSYSAIGTKNSPSLGIEITPLGFKLYNGAASALEGITPMVNAQNVDFGYIILK